MIKRNLSASLKGDRLTCLAPTPAYNREFTDHDGASTALASGPAFGHLDLLTALTHEMGHILGF
jgi:hypothetical protein